MLARCDALGNHRRSHVAVQMTVDLMVASKQVFRAPLRDAEHGALVCSATTKVQRVPA